MTDIVKSPALDQLGDHLVAAIDRDLRRSRSRPVRRIGFAVVILAIVGTGTAAAAGLFSPKQVAVGMPAGAAIFHQTDPTCVLRADGRSFRCTLASVPESDGIDPGKGGDVAPMDYRGSKQLLAIHDRIAGGCIGQDEAGLSWDCYIGQDAVDHEILVPDLLGQPELEPGHG